MLSKLEVLPAFANSCHEDINTAILTACLLLLGVLPKEWGTKTSSAAAGSNATPKLAGCAPGELSRPGNCKHANTLPSI